MASHPMDTFLLQHLCQKAIMPLPESFQKLKGIHFISKQVENLPESSRLP